MSKGDRSSPVFSGASLVRERNTEQENGRRERKRRSTEDKANSSEFIRLRKRSKMGRLLVQHLDSSKHGLSRRRHPPLQAQILPALHRPYTHSLFSFLGFSIHTRRDRSITSILAGSWSCGGADVYFIFEHFFVVEFFDKWTDSTS